ncbi:MAG: hypothetical protein SGJ20_01615 [Planctomycetota bacterium]|nr:hypothetical protein [Planctomycetota bacterium]
MSAFVWPSSLAAVLAIFSSGCVEVSQPLSSEKDSVVDTRLIGTWDYTEDGKATPERFVVGRKAGSTTIMELTSPNEEGSTPVHTKQFGKHNYLSVLDESEDGKSKAWYVAAYDFPDKNTVRLLGLNNDKIKELIKNKKIAGTVTQKDFVDEIRITEEPAKLADFLEKNFQACFDHEEPTVFKRAQAANPKAKATADKKAATDATPAKSDKGAKK